MTKIIILGQESKKKPIKLIKYLHKDLYFEPSLRSANDWENIELICRNYGYNKLDLMYAYPNNSRENGTLYIGHFNDGII